MSDAKTSYGDIIAKLRSAYDGSAAARDATPKAEWKQIERSAFLQRLRAEGKTRLLEIGAGTGQDGAFFQENGLRVVATDLSSEMVARCRAKGLEAHVMDFLSLAFPAASFDACWAFACLLHVPNADFAAVLAVLRELLAPGALLYVGVYGGPPSEGVLADDWHDPPRFFSFRTDDELVRMVTPYFEILDFHLVPTDSVPFQALTLRR